MNINSDPIYILGISCFYHDAAAVLIKDGMLVAAVQEERFTRKKHDDAFPRRAIEYCLKEAGIAVADLAYVGFYDKPILKFDRLLQSFFSSWPRSYATYIRALPVWLREKLSMRKIIRKELKFKGPIYFAEHHMSHAASAFFVSPFKEAAILTTDGVGEWATSSYGVGKDSGITLLKEVHYPDSLGLFYSMLTHFLGFKPNSAEYKVMGLAPYGLPQYVDQLRTLIHVHDDGSYTINRKVFGDYFDTGGIEKKLESLFGFSRRSAADTLEQKHKDLAASLQAITNEAMVKAAVYVRRETGMENLCMAGGVALNCVANSEILKHAGFKNIFIQPAAGDAGGALGVAYYIWHQVLGKSRNFEMKHCFWGPSFSNEEIERFLQSKHIKSTRLTDDAMASRVADLIEKQHVIGLLRGRMEWGPRSLGARSILADARNKENWQRVNLKIKFRESFRPFAPSVLEEDAREYFDFNGPSPYMLFTAPVKKDTIPAVTHVDGTARLQTVNAEVNSFYYKLISQFKKLTGCSVIINTSFNIRGEPIVCAPEDAFNTFIKTDIDYLVLENFIIDKKDVILHYPFVKPAVSETAD